VEAVLILKDGTTFVGEGFGATGTAFGEVVFHTGMTGYQEIITDPSYKGQMVTLTYPHIGNTGINPEDMESAKPQVEALIVREACLKPSNWRSAESLDGYLKRHGIIGLHEIDTRRLTRHLREKGSMMGVLCTDGTSIDELKIKLADYPAIEGRDLVKFVTSSKSETWKESADVSWYDETFETKSPIKHKVVAYDFGMKWNISRLLTSFGMEVTVVPADTPAEKVLKLKPDGVFLSNGPGDPSALDYAVENIRKLQSLPIFGICLGHQLLGRAYGAKTYKLKFGHHGANHPVKHLATGEIEITSQNHNFAVDPDDLIRCGFELTHLNLNDRTVEGMHHKEYPAFSVQYHPEASPGPHDSIYLFRKFIELMEKNRSSVMGDW
jgi:carbamoyl-phosphate synthase small subunit